MKQLIAYYRVSTAKQGKSGLGLEAQQAAVADYTRASGETVLREYIEVESGKKSNRPELRKALTHAKRSKGILVVAKLDRLSRNVAFLSQLMESGTDFICCDNPQATPVLIHVMVAFAEHEAKAISQRTKSALAAYIARGGRLGAAREECRNLNEAAMAKGQKLAAIARREKADEAYQDLYPALTEWRDNGLTLQAITDKLNAEGYKTRRGKDWNRMQVLNVLKRAARLQPTK